MIHMMIMNVYHLPWGEDAIAVEKTLHQLTHGVMKLIFQVTQKITTECSHQYLVFQYQSLGQGTSQHHLQCHPFQVGMKALL